MSTFGKKSLGWWNYEDHSKLNVVRYNHTPIELQLSILEKWYPIGLLFRKSYTSARIYKIIGYKQISNIWLIEYDLSGVIFDSLVNPVLIIPLSEHIITIKRNNKLEKLFRK